MAIELDALTCPSAIFLEISRQKSKDQYTSILPLENSPRAVKMYHQDDDEKSEKIPGNAYDMTNKRLLHWAEVFKLIGCCEEGLQAMEIFGTESFFNIIRGPLPDDCY
jgi:hypothetical protein